MWWLSLTSFRTTARLTSSWSSVTITNDIYSDTACSFTTQSLTFSNEDWTEKEMMTWTASWWTLTITERWLSQT